MADEAGYQDGQKTEWLHKQLQNAINLRSAQDQVTWNIFGVFWAANAILLVVLFQNGEFPPNAIGMVIAGVGASLSWVWHLIQGRAIGHVKRHKNLMQKLEEDLKIPREYAVSARINIDNYEKTPGKGIAARKIMPCCSFGVAILWTLAFLFFLIKLIWSCI